MMMMMMIIIIIIIRQNMAALYIYWTIRKRMGFQVTDKYYEHVPERVININGTAIMWDVLVVTDRTISAN